MQYVFLSDKTKQKLISIDYFSNIGQSPSEIFEGQYNTVSSWDEAYKLFGSARTREAYEHERSKLTRFLSSNFRTEFRNWNKIVDELKMFLDDHLNHYLEQKLELSPELMNTNHSKDHLLQLVKWDLIGFGLEQAYAEFTSPAFYSNLIHIYEAGHLNCSFKGTWPDGLFWIY